MANLMVANGMEDEGPKKEEFLKKYSRELKKSDLKRDPIFRKSQKTRKLTPLEEVKELRQRLHAIDAELAETRYTSRETIGAENARIGYDSLLKQDRIINGNRTNTEKDFKELALSFASPTKKFWYKTMDMFGLFQPEKVIEREAKKLDNYISDFSELKDKYREEVKELDKEISELRKFAQNSDKLISELEAKVKSNPGKKDELQQDIDSASESFIEFYNDIESAKENRRNTISILQVVSKQIRKYKHFRRSLVGEINSNYNQAELNKVLEAYEQI